MKEKSDNLPEEKSTNDHKQIFHNEEKSTNDHTEKFNESFTKNEQNSNDWNLKLDLNSMLSLSSDSESSSWNFKLLGENLDSMPPCSSESECSSIKSAELNSINNFFDLCWEKKIHLEITNLYYQV